MDRGTSGINASVTFNFSDGIMEPKNRWAKPCAFLRIFFDLIMRAIMVPATWVLICFLRGDYYVCAFYPDTADSLPCQMHKV